MGSLLPVSVAGIGVSISTLYLYRRRSVGEFPLESVVLTI